jgi:hypothetical protein
MVATFASVLRLAKPSPGKCFIDGRTPLATSPDANALLRLAATDASNENVRPCWYMNEAVDDGTSATGAKLLLMPAQASTLPVAFPWLAAVVALPMAPICGGARVGGAQLNRFHAATLLVGGDQQRWPVARCRGLLEPAGQADELRGRCDVGAEQDHAADLAAPDPAEQVCAGGDAVHGDHQLLPDHLAKRRAAWRQRLGRNGPHRLACRCSRGRARPGDHRTYDGQGEKRSKNLAFHVARTAESRSARGGQAWAEVEW